VIGVFADTSGLLGLVDEVNQAFAFDAHFEAEGFSLVS
jgi:hypothetical protein